MYQAMDTILIHRITQDIIPIQNIILIHNIQNTTTLILNILIIHRNPGGERTMMTLVDRITEELEIIEGIRINRTGYQRNEPNQDINFHLIHVQYNPRKKYITAIENLLGSNNNIGFPLKRDRSTRLYMHRCHNGDRVQIDIVDIKFNTSGSDYQQEWGEMLAYAKEIDKTREKRKQKNNHQVKVYDTP